MMDWRLWKSAIGYWSSPKHQGHGRSAVFFHICTYVLSWSINYWMLVGWLPKQNTDVGKDLADFSVLFLHIC